ncbi:hypothetical protein SKTS_24080 [Sulfurimicrobium lacus]|uniref:Lipoprotein n=2 Tax=Sulfurimicrobium lacus TaxID=2715678 RepID=A0A6F8VEZ7_9PROT|nr:hypothetical protein SKTS_24080 [Sulfurimicrobium lacus]
MVFKRKNKAKLAPLVRVPAWRKLLMAVALLAAGCSAGTGSGGYREAGQIVSMPPKPDKVDPRALAATCSYTGLYGVALESCVRLLAAKLPPFDPTKPDHFGELYSPQKYYECKLKNPSNLGCEEFALRRPENPEYWPYPGVPKPKWPEAPKKSVYRAGMDGKEYFDALCKAEAGEFIYRTVENVEGIHVIRPRARQEGDKGMDDRYVIEDPYANAYSDIATEPEFYFVGPKRDIPIWSNSAKIDIAKIGRYRYIESAAIASPPLTVQQSFYDWSYATPMPEGSIVARYYGYDTKERETMKKEYADKAMSRYGYTWRGISRPHDRELGVAGSELAAVDLTTGEILGIRRGFRFSATRDNRRVNWLRGSVCPNHAPIDPGPINGGFILKVLKPSQTIFEQKEMNK